VTTLNELVEKLCSNREDARKFSVRAGIYNPDGMVHENYGGERARKFAFIRHFDEVITPEVRKLPKHNQRNNKKVKRK
jgi:hypothetical protein